MMIYIVNGRPVCVENDVLIHHGVKGMKWGVRKKIQDVYNGVRKAQSRIKQVENSYNRLATKTRNSKLATSAKNIVSSKKSSEPSKNLTPEEARKQKVKRAVKIGAAVAGTALAVYGAKKLSDSVVQRASERYWERMARDVDRMRRQHDLSYQRYWLSQNKVVTPKRRFG